MTYIKNTLFQLKIHDLRPTPSRLVKIAKIYFAHRDWDIKTFAPCGLEFIKDWNGKSYTHFDVYDIRTLEKIDCLCK